MTQAYEADEADKETEPAPQADGADPDPWTAVSAVEDDEEYNVYDGYEAEEKERAEDAPALDDEDAGEFGEEGPVANVVDEFDGPVSVADVFGTLGSYDPDFEAVYGDPDDEVEEKKPELSPEIIERRSHADDDSNEFYSATDAEYPEGPYTPQMEKIFETREASDGAPVQKKRWKVKRSMSITDEFKAIKNEDDD